MKTKISFFAIPILAFAFVFFMPKSSLAATPSYSSFSYVAGSSANSAWNPASLSFTSSSLTFNFSPGTSCSGSFGLYSVYDSSGNYLGGSDNYGPNGIKYSVCSGTQNTVFLPSTVATGTTQNATKFIFVLSSGSDPALNTSTPPMNYDQSLAAPSNFTDLGMYYGTLSYVPPPPPTSVSFTFPTNGTTTPDFQNWQLTTQVSTSTDYYTSAVLYQEAGQVGSFYDTIDFPGLSATSSISQYIGKEHNLAAYNATTTWSASAYIVDTSMPNTDTLLPIAGTIVASSSAIQFQVLPTQSASAGTTYPTLTVPTDTVSNYQVATTTCSSWLDITCEMGNWSTNVFNFLFNINQADIQAASGFQLANTPPWSFIPEIENDFTNASALSTSTLASGQWRITIGNDSATTTFFSEQSAEAYATSPIAALIKNILYASLVLLFIFGAYREIKAIFGHKEK